MTFTWATSTSYPPRKAAASAPSSWQGLDKSVFRYHGDGRQLDQEIFVPQAGHHHRGAGRRGIGPEHRAAHLLYHRQLGAIGEIGGDGDQVLQAPADRLQDRGDVLEALLGLAPHVALANQVFFFLPGHLAGEMNDPALVLDHVHGKAAPSWMPSAAWIEASCHGGLH